MAEDTWALNEGVIDEPAFLDQAYSIFEERKGMFLSALKNTRRGVVACVFDTSDRVQHMFFWSHGRRRSGTSRRLKRCTSAWTRWSAKLCRLSTQTHRILRFLPGCTAALPHFDAASISTPGYVHQSGYLALKPDAEAGSFFEGVDWSKTLLPTRWARAACI